jgi:hypothetical protein
MDFSVGALTVTQYIGLLEWPEIWRVGHRLC